MELPGPLPVGEFISKEMDKSPLRGMFFVLLGMLGIAIYIGFALLNRLDKANDIIIQSEREKRQIQNDALLQKFATTAAVEEVSKKLEQSQKQQAEMLHALELLKKRKR